MVEAAAASPRLRGAEGNQLEVGVEVSHSGISRGLGAPIHRVRRGFTNSSLGADEPS